ncbi:MAG: ABC-F family ATP-binding cassette domain-containing protein [Roseiflexaceae bacterium]
MLQIRNLYKAYGPATVLAGVDFVINAGEHVGLIGPNGAGKSTILRCVIGSEQPDRGAITRIPADLVIGYLSQALDLPENLTVAEYLAQVQAEFRVAEQALAQASDALAVASDLEAAMAAYDQALTQFEVLGGYEREHRAQVVLEGLGLTMIARERSLASLSGGQKTRLGLAGLLLCEPGLLLLDEPTNHLDVEALEWLESFMQNYPHAVLVVSHDRAFLDRTVTRILYLDGETRKVRSYPGSYTAFAAARAQEHANQLAAWQDQQQYISAVEADIRRIKGQAQGIQDGPKRGRDFYGRISAKVARIAKTRERKLERFLESDQRIEKPRQGWGLKLDFGSPPEGGRAVLRLDQVQFAYPAHPPVLEHVSLEVGYGERVALVGPNGAGKTTLLKLIAGTLTPQQGSVRLGAGVRLGVLAQEHETLDPLRSVLETALRARPMSETEARTFLHLFLFGGDSVFRPVGACSLGERSRLQLALLVLAGCNLLLLDEPLNHLDIDGKEHFEQALDAYEGTVIVVSHDRMFVESYAERLLIVQDGQIREA